MFELVCIVTMFKVIVPETNASRHLFFTNKRIQREGMVTEMRGALLFPQEGRSEEMTPAPISPNPPEEVKPKPTDRIADVLPFSVRAKPGFVPPSGFFCLFFTPEIISIIAIFKD